MVAQLPKGVLLSRLQSLKTQAGITVDQYRSVHNDFAVIVTALGIVVFPGFLLKGHFFDLLNVLAQLNRGEAVSLLHLIQFATETLIVASAFFLLLNFYFSEVQAVEKSRNVYRGRHACIQTRTVPVFLLHEEIVPEDDTMSLYNAGFQGVSTQDEYLLNNPSIKDFASDMDAYLKACQAVYPETNNLTDPAIARGEPATDEPARYVSLLDMINQNS